MGKFRKETAKWGNEFASQLFGYRPKPKPRTFGNYGQWKNKDHSYRKAQEWAKGNGFKK